MMGDGNQDIGMHIGVGVSDRRFQSGIVLINLCVALFGCAVCSRMGSLDRCLERIIARGVSEDWCLLYTRLY